MNRWYWIIAFALTAFVWGLSAWYYPSLPQTIPTHWNIHGKVDGHGDKSWAVFLVPLMTTAMPLLFLALPTLSPKQFEVDSFRSTYLFIMVGIVALFAYMQVMILLATWQEVRGGDKWLDLGRALMGGMFVFFVLIGQRHGQGAEELLHRRPGPLDARQRPRLGRHPPTGRLADAAGRRSRSGRHFDRTADSVGVRRPDVLGSDSCGLLVLPLQGP